MGGIYNLEGWVGEAEVTVAKVDLVFGEGVDWMEGVEEEGVVMRGKVEED